MKRRFVISVFFLIHVLFGGYNPVEAQPYQWNNVAIGGGGFVTGIITSKTEANLMYARTDVGGAYRWNSATSKWMPLLDWTSINETGYQGVEALAIDPQAPSKVYMLVGTSYFNGGKTAILSSSDYGNTFTVTEVTSQFRAHGNGMGRQNGERLAVDPNNGSILLCGTRAHGLWKTTNAGGTWAQIGFPVTTTANGNGINFVVFDPSSATTGNPTQTIFVGVSQTGTNFYRSNNGGTSFTAVTGGPSLMPQRAVQAGTNLFITYADNEGPWNINSGQIWKYAIPTGTWTNVTPAGFTFGFGGISVDPANPSRLIASSTNAYWTQYGTAYGDRIFLSTNGGTTWRDLVGTGITMDPNGCTWINGNSIHWAGCVEFNPFNTNQAWIISGNGVFSCDNVNATTTTWKFNSIGMEETVPLDIVSITGGPLVSVIGDYDGFKHSNITQFSPIHNPTMGTTTGLAFASLNTNILVRVGNDMYYTTNQGTNWTQCTMNGDKGKVAVSANGNIFIHCPETSGTLYRSANNGTSWTTCSGVNITDAAPAADMVNNNKFYAYNNGSGAMMVSTDGGVNFSAAGYPGTGGSKIIRTVPGLEGHIWIAMNGGGLKRSVNSGTSFTTITGVSNCAAIGLGKAAPGATYHTIYIWGTVGGVTGVFRSIDEGSTWLRVNDDAHEYGGPGNGQFVIGDMNMYGRVYMSTVGRGIAYGDIPVAAPVELNFFNAFPESQFVKLQWTTASETNNDFFIVERSNDGENFSPLEKIKGAGNSSAVSFYQYIDQHPYEEGINYYRLKQVDFDGSFSYSSIQKAETEREKSYVYPVPAGDQLTLVLEEAPSCVEFFDISGRSVYRNETVTDSKFHVTLSGLPKGLYFIRIVTSKKVSTVNFLKD